MRRPRVLVIEDNRKTAESIRLYLDHAGIGVAVSHDGRRGLELAKSGNYDLVILDLMLPRVSGLDICRALRSLSEIPIIMLTAKTTEEDRLRGFEIGADDYVSKPFSPRELVARVLAVWKRSTHREDDAYGVIAHGELLIDVDRHRGAVAGREIRLTPTEFRILTTLARRPGHVMTREELIRRAFGDDFDADDRVIDAHVMKIRKKLEVDPTNPTYVQTVYGVGYRFSPPNDDS